MATDFWASSHYNRWMVDRATLKQARAEDSQYVDDEEYLNFLPIFFANLIAKLGKKLQMRQRVIATATIFFKRFYVKNSYCDTDPFIVIAACCYVAAKAEEAPVHIKNVVSEARMLFNNEELGAKSFSPDHSKLAEMEFYLVDDLECDLTVFHPYRTLMALCGKDGSAAEAGELGAGVDDGPRYWGTGEGKLELQEGALQMAWFIINDTYRSDLPLLYPPHLIAIAAIYLTLVLHSSTRALLHAQTNTQSAGSASSAHASAQQGSARRSSRSSSAHAKKAPQDIVGFMAGLNVSMPLVATLAQEIIALYVRWERYREDAHATQQDSARGAFAHTYAKRAASVGSAGTASTGATPSADEPSAQGPGERVPLVVTPALMMQVLANMRERCQRDREMAAHGQGGRTVAVNKVLERAQAAG
ncbi:cyclin-like protein [Wolfiporia cocos MD-104 SS10]|uniref:Cyclin-like protein n=1 Tax=Wolfiporia cocos (strain MD-104) TaxID=742152 RepID=A0A2H3JY62_WOLCO|nr:cyclin-like protein [Wolfiporia cocos MD-104 SS10]